MPLSQYNIAPPPTKTEFDNLSNNFNPSIHSVTPTSGITIECGGYYKLGKIVIVFLRLQLSHAVTADTILITGLPAYTYKSSGHNSIILASNKVPISARYNGDAACTAALDAGTIIMSGIYVCD